MSIPNQFVQALLRRDLKAAKELLAGGIDINQTYEPMGWTALHYAIEMDVTESVLWLLENGANPNQKDASGCTSLHLAIDGEGDNSTRSIIETGKYYASVKLTKILLTHGADPNAVNTNGKTPISIAKGYGHAEAVDLLKQSGAHDT
jgi:uncharacterized protein